jgi:hypothetical protein
MAETYRDAQVSTMAADTQPAADEDYWTGQLIELLKYHLAKDWAGTTMRRDAHSKAHGLVEAEFTVASDIPESLRVGLFREPRTYKAWIRFSNSANSIQSDRKRDVLGMAIKILDAGPPGSGFEGTQDFLLASAPAFIVRNLEQFYHLLTAFLGGPWRFAWYFTRPRNLPVLYEMLKVSKRWGSPFTAEYWSMSAYSLGSRVVKYSTRPMQTSPSGPPRGGGPDYLRAAMKTQLAAAPAMFSFMVQERTDPDRMPIDDASVEWDEHRAPYRTVATIRIVDQPFDTPERWTLAENLSFAPWHCLPEHRPLGTFNRARKRAYEALSAFRHERNGVAPQPPLW